MDVPRNPSEERRNSYCPKCVIARGSPQMVTFGVGYQEMTYVCPKCHHEWKVTASLVTPPESV
jgi:hypothetical protein